MPIITLSRGSKSGGLALAEMLAAELKCDNVISREILVKVSEEYGVTEKELSEAMSKPPHFWERSSGNPRRLYQTFVRAALLEYACKGCLIYHGNAGHFLLRDISWVLKVRLIVPLEQRIAMLQQTMKMDRFEATQYIKKVDDERMKWTKFLYGVDWSDPVNFDVVVNLATMSLKTACQTIVCLTKLPEFIRTEQRVKELADKTLAARVLAVLESKPETRGANIEIGAEGPIVALSGHLAQANMRSVLVETANGVSGVSEVKDLLSNY